MSVLNHGWPEGVRVTAERITIATSRVAIETEIWRRESLHRARVRTALFAHMARACTYCHAPKGRECYRVGVTGKRFLPHKCRRGRNPSPFR